MTPTMATQGNETHNYTTEEVHEYLAMLQSKSNYAFIPTFVYLAVFIVIGCIGNGLVIVVYSTKLTRTPLRIFIVGMAIFDLLTNTFVMPAKIHELTQMWDSDKSTLCKIQKFLNSSFVVSSAFILVAIATTRFKMVCHPFGKQVTIKQAKVICVVLALSAFVISIPYGIIHGTQTKQTPNPNIKGRYCQVDDSYVKTVWPRLNSGLFIVLFLVCSTLITVFYVFIGRTTWKQRNALCRAQPKSSGQQSKSEKSDSCTLSSDERNTYSKTEGTSVTSDTELVLRSDDAEIANLDNSDAKQTSMVANYGDTKSGSCVLEREQELSEKIVTNSESCITKTPDKPNGKPQNTSLDKHISFAKNKEFITIPQVPNSHTKPVDMNKTIQQRNINQQRRLFGRTSLMMFTVTLVFFVGFLPFLGLNVFLAISPQKVAGLEGSSLALYQLFLSSYLLNSFANPIVYSLLDMRFRKECFKLLKCSRNN